MEQWEECFDTFYAISNSTTSRNMIGSSHDWSCSFWIGYFCNVLLNQLQPIFFVLSFVFNWTFWWRMSRRPERGWTHKVLSRGGTNEYDAGSNASSTVQRDLAVTIIGSWSKPGFSWIGNWKIDIPLPWNDDVAVRDVGLWSRLSRAATVNKCCFRFEGQTIPEVFALSPRIRENEAIIVKTVSQDTLKPYLWRMLISFRLLVSWCI